MTDQGKEAVVSALRQANNILVLGHVHPDPDALGSQLALGRMLRSMGKSVSLYAESPVSHHYTFLPDSELISSDLSQLADFDCLVALDCGDVHRLGAAKEHLLTVKPVLVVDHHVGHIDFGDLRWVDPKRAATGEMVYDLGLALGAEIDQETAFCLYSALVADTGSFKFSSTSADTFRVARDLVMKGVKPAKVAGKLFDNYTMPRLVLLQKVLSTLSLHADSRIAIISAPKEAFSQTGAEPEDSEGFINYPRSLASVLVAVFIKESSDGLISVSLRSKGKYYDMSKVAACFGGGGHINAAGFRRHDSSIERVKSELLPVLRNILPQLD